MAAQQFQEIALCMQVAHPACTVGTLLAQGFRGIALSENITAIATPNLRKMPDPKSLFPALLPSTGNLSQLDTVALLRMFSKDSVRVRLIVLSALLIAQLSLRLIVLSARLTTIVAVVLCTRVT
jgi:hypothetical protein